ncbi:hypothetical protein [Roseimicrobium sp. ORNL1]|uniref:hypothetical protein n=1 Tax=Roseimicrobium sp. ORNL1 TaxID=2711231 RepID=UPI0013E1F451|nr:hypothetical protein [Roseimicrobium sp. ORNL1]QIF03710.1 hypothetical protein G5S37_20025 [Roseimicrobium sp. ORNL1]
MLIPEENIERRWITAGNSGIWDTLSTYTFVEYSRVPALPLTHSLFDWLSEIPARDYDGSTLDSPDNNIASYGSIESELQALGFSLPEEIEILMRQPEIQAQIPTCTGCYLEFADTVTPLPGYPGNYVVRFMNDSQCCVMWYLLFQRSRPTRVLVSNYFIEQDIFEAMHYLAEEDVLLSYDDALKSIYICAQSPGEFIFRFCLENTIWFATHGKLPLSPLEREYLDHAKKSA